MSRLRYVPAAYGAGAVELDGPLTYVGTGANIRSAKWEYTLGARGISNQIRKAREVSADIYHTDTASMDAEWATFERDVLDGRPGTLVVTHETGEWSQRAYVVALIPSTITERWVKGSATILLLDGVWSRPSSMTLKMWTPGGSAQLDLPCDLPCDLTPPRPPSTIEVPGTTPCPVKLVAFGPVTNPAITIGGNKYQVNVEVPNGSRLEIDGHSWPKTVELVSVDGTRSNAFGHRLAGASGSGSYIFEPVSPGVDGSPSVTWDGTFRAVVTLYEERSMPPWS